MWEPLLLIFLLSPCFPLIDKNFFTSFTEQNLMVFCSSCSERNFSVSMVRFLRFPYLGRREGLFSSLLMTPVVCKLADLRIMQQPFRWALVVMIYNAWKWPELNLPWSAIYQPLCLTVENNLFSLCISVVSYCYLQCFEIRVDQPLFLWLFIQSDLFFIKKNEIKKKIWLM